MQRRPSGINNDRHNSDQQNHFFKYC